MIKPRLCFPFNQVCPASPSCHLVGVPSMWRKEQACRWAVCWPSGAERDTSWSAATKSPAMSERAKRSGATTYPSAKVHRSIFYWVYEYCIINGQPPYLMAQPWSRSSSDGKQMMRSVNISMFYLITAIPRPEDRGLRVAVLASVVSGIVIFAMSLSFLVCCLQERSSRDRAKKDGRSRWAWTFGWETRWLFSS